MRSALDLFKAGKFQWQSISTKETPWFTRLQEGGVRLLGLFNLDNVMIFIIIMLLTNVFEIVYCYPFFCLIITKPSKA